VTVPGSLNHSSDSFPVKIVPVEHQEKVAFSSQLLPSLLPEVQTPTPPNVKISLFFLNFKTVRIYIKIEIFARQRKALYRLLFSNDLKDARS